MSVGAVHREINNRPKLCPVCELRVQSSNLARHRRKHAREYGWVGAKNA